MVDKFLDRVFALFAALLYILGFLMMLGPMFYAEAYGDNNWPRGGYD